MPAGAQRRLDLVGRPLGRAVGDGSPRQRLAQAGGELVAVELLAGPVALDDDQARRLDPLVGREAGAAGDALPPAPDRRGLVEVARVDDAGVALLARRTAHPVLLRPPHHYI